MARSTELGECVAGVLGLWPTTTASHVRNLREAGLLTKTGRGITGAHMVARDAAYLLIAATCSQDVKDSVDTVQRYGKLRHVGNAWRDFPALAALGEQHTFADALATLLDSASIQFLADDPKSTVSVTFDHPNTGVVLKVSTRDWDRDQEYRPSWPGNKHARIRTHVGDRRVLYTFTEQTIFTVGDLLRGED